MNKRNIEKLTKEIIKKAYMAKFQPSAAVIGDAIAAIIDFDPDRVWIGYSRDKSVSAKNSKEQLNKQREETMKAR